MAATTLQQLITLVLTLTAIIESNNAEVGGGMQYHYCTPFEWSQPQNYDACLEQQQSAFARSAAIPPISPFAGPVFDNNYFNNWRTGFNNWQQNFQAQLQQNLLQMRQRFAELEKQNRINGQNNPNGYYQSSHQSSFSDSSGTSESVVSSSNNLGSWTIRSNGLGISSSSNGNQMSINVFVGDGATYDTKIINDKELLVEVTNKNDSVKRWLSMKITSGELTAHNFQVSRPQADTILIQNI